MSSLFISYSRRDHQIVDAIAGQLRMEDYSLWIDRKSILGGQQWRSKIVEAIKASSAVVLIISKSSVSSNDVRKEVDLAETYRKTILPIRIHAIDIPSHLEYQLAGTQIVQYSREATFLSEIKDALDEAGIDSSSTDGTTDFAVTTPANSLLKFFEPLLKNTRFRIAAMAGLGLAAGFFFVQRYFDVSDSPIKGAYVVSSFQSTGTREEVADLRGFSKHLRETLDHIHDNAIEVQPTSFDESTFAEMSFSRLEKEEPKAKTIPSILLKNRAGRCNRIDQTFTLLSWPYEYTDGNWRRLPGFAKVQGRSQDAGYLALSVVFQLMQKARTTDRFHLTEGEEQKLKQEMLNQYIEIHNIQNRPPEQLEESGVFQLQQADHIPDAEIQRLLALFDAGATKCSDPSSLKAFTENYRSYAL